MKSETYPYKVAAVYPDDVSTEAAIDALSSARLGDVEIVRLAPGSSEVDLAIEPEREETRNTVVQDTVTGSLAGTAAGAVLTGAATLGAPALFVSAPLVGPLVVLGYGAMIGGTIGAIRGLKLRENMLSGLVKDSLKAGYHVVIVHAANEEAQTRVQDVISKTMAEETVSA
jgi:hypothetical protein